MGKVRGIRKLVDRDNFKEEILLSSNEKLPQRKNTTNKIITYTVKKGDTLSKIAYKYDTIINQIIGLNGIKNKNKNQFYFL